ncbi:MULTISPECIES: bifunctional phosphopantothenoylcysteine decarboxylase/phosphopantothenate--cysteine ligase CoaBC [Methanobacterium]|uniref:Coenzyme A biosynthesis bifunctional protein CoaBC n=1 Tax=Methanobacterium bryantii TaxID=2161 RepID=A0A2A2H729_METBR|nr:MULTISPECIES: bifunctional phosphopantothenoylcysteine decarboxylase/phosphopantothenate--cysteine ligase CoaBC [Methanobacterium]OEC84966.1 bifunctional phosphopantothenoylcysteine decarboxylase/phosphopantothenate synthase [Methanobacterium sp. A39]PAV05116.1 bifunctional phosphopantothenoylcysteine decarboxylase/phosphopantothenate synthase [Methanobacterium bryantii]
MEIVLCVTGSIAAIESIKLARELARHGINVKCFMSDGACEIIHPYAMEFATGQDAVTKITGKIEHVKYANADLILVAPATANVISKFAYKIADNPINTLLITAFGYNTPILMVPSMHNSMYKAVKENIETLKGEGITFVKPKVEEKKAKFPDINDIVLHVMRETSKMELRGKKVLVSAGSTYEKIDEVRGITNRSSGKMGIEIAKEAFIRGADVTLIKGQMTADVPHIFDVVEVESSSQMHYAVSKLASKSDVFVSSAAVSDFKVKNAEAAKISSDTDITIELERTPKILNEVKEINPDIFLVGFKAVHNLSDEELLNAAKKRMLESDADLMVANDVAVEGAGFGSDDNQVVLMDDEIIEISLSPKREIAKRIVDRIVTKSL